MTIEPIQDDEEQRFRTMTELIHGTEEQRSAFDFACKAITWRSHLYQWCSIAWRAAGLFPENMFRVLHQLPEPSPTLLITPSVISSDTIPFVLTESPLNPSHQQPGLSIRSHVLKRPSTVQESWLSSQWNCGKITNRSHDFAEGID